MSFSVGVIVFEGLISMRLPREMLLGRQDQCVGGGERRQMRLHRMSAYEDFLFWRALKRPEGQADLRRAELMRVFAWMAFRELYR